MKIRFDKTTRDIVRVVSAPPRRSIFLEETVEDAAWVEARDYLRGPVWHSVFEPIAGAIITDLS